MLKINEDGRIPISPPRASASAMRDALNGCPLRSLLDKMYETGHRYGWNVLGTAIHLAVEKVATDGLDLDQAKDVAHDYIWTTIQKWDEAGHQVRYSNGRSMATLEDDVDDMLNGWFIDVHPDSPDRHFRYMAYRWPFEPEVECSRPGFHTSIDAVFHAKEGGGVALVDWKTGTSPKADPIQMHTYEWAWTEFHGTPVQATWFHHLAHREMQDTDDTYPGAANMSQLADYTQIIQEIMTLRIQPKPHWVCGKANLCPHRDQERCPAFGGSLQSIREDAKLLLVTEV